MSAWRREALNRLPECKPMIDAASNPMALWIELLLVCEDAVKMQAGEFVNRLYDFANWSWQSPNEDLRTAVACAFYEHLPIIPCLRSDLPRRRDRVPFHELRTVFCYHLTPQEAAQFEQEFRAVSK